MKIKNLLRFSSLVGAVAMASVSHAQSTFYFSLDSNDINVSGVDAVGQVDFFDTSPGTVNVDIYNNSTIPASITGFYMLLPAQINLIDTVTSSTHPTWGKVDQGSNSMISVLNEYYNPVGNANWWYFGAESAGGGDGIVTGDMGTFNFTMFGDFTYDFDDFFASQEGNPHIFVRWQSVGDDGEGSAKGFGYFDTDIPPDWPGIPEPRLIAPLAALGLGGLLWTRRRLARKKQ